MVSEGNHNISLSKYATVFIVLGVKASVVWERRGGRRETNIDFPYWPVITSLDHTTLCYFQGST